MNDRQIDQVLVERAQKGDHKAFEMLMSKYQRRLNRLISRFIQDEHEVHDVTQEAMIRAYRALVNFRGERRILYMAVPYRHQYGKRISDYFGSSVFFVSSEAANEEGGCSRFNRSGLRITMTPEAEMMNRENLADRRGKHCATARRYASSHYA